MTLTFKFLLIFEVSSQIFDKVITCKINSSDIYNVRWVKIAEKPISFKKRKQDNVIQSGEKFSTLLKLNAKLTLYILYGNYYSEFT